MENHILGLNTLKLFLEGEGAFPSESCLQLILQEINKNKRENLHLAIRSFIIQQTSSKDQQ